MNTNIVLIEFSPKLEDGSRKIINETVLATCKAPGTANLIVSLLKNQESYKKLLERKGDNESIYGLTAEKRKPIKF